MKRALLIAAGLLVVTPAFAQLGRPVPPKRPLGSQTCTTLAKSMQLLATNISRKAKDVEGATGSLYSLKGILPSDVAGSFEPIVTSNAQLASALRTYRDDVLRFGNQMARCAGMPNLSVD
jgi:hypothetical protein